MDLGGDRNQPFQSRHWPLRCAAMLLISLIWMIPTGQTDELDALPGQKDKLEPLYTPKRINLPEISRKELLESIHYAQQVAKNQKEIIEPNILENGIVLKPGTPGWYYAATARTKVVSKNYSNTAIVLNVASKMLAEKYQLSKEEVLYGLPTLDIREAGLKCPLPPSAIPCHPGRFRSHNGHCNNVQHPHWGSSAMPFRRDLPADYADGVSLPRGASQPPAFHTDEQPIEAASNPKKTTVIPERATQLPAVNFDPEVTLSRLRRSYRQDDLYDDLYDDATIWASLGKDSEYDLHLESSSVNNPVYFDSDVGENMHTVNYTENPLKRARRQTRRKSNTFHTEPIVENLESITESSAEVQPSEQDELSYGLPDVRSVSLLMHTPLGKKVTGSVANAGNSQDETPAIEGSGEDPSPAPISALMSVFMQFVFHDLAHVAQSVGHRGHRIRCCSLPDRRLRHPECWPLSLKPVDPLYPQHTCMEYVRSCQTVRPGCTLGAREQINQVTSYLDASVVYGSSEEEARELREFVGGRLRMQRIGSSENGIDLLPPADGAQDCRSANRSRCFRAGDIRVNEHPSLTLMHTFWARQHNRQAGQLQQLNLHWSDERLYQETRRLISAQLQHITFSELVPAILGQQSQALGLSPTSSGFYYGYEMSLDSAISNSLAVSVFPFVYTMLPTRLHRYTDQMRPAGARKMRDAFFDPGLLYDRDAFDQLALGMLVQRARWPKLWSGSALASGVGGVGEPDPRGRAGHSPIDVMAVWLQRGRDHGIPGYTSWRRACRLRPSINDFTDLNKIMSSLAIRQFQMLYRNVEDIDLLTGALAEKPLRGALVGPTFACLLGRQLQRIKRGDRYWYENDQPPNGFSLQQLNQIRKTTLASILCENMNQPLFVQPEAMHLSDEYLNAFQRCEDLPKIDLSFWTEHLDEGDFGEETMVSARSEDSVNASPYLHPEMLHQAIRNAFTELRNTRNRLNNHQIVQPNLSITSPTSSAGGLAAVLRPKREALQRNERAVLLQLVSGQLVTSMLKQYSKDEEHTNELRGRLLATVRSLPQLQLPEYVEKNELNTYSESSVARVCSEAKTPCDHSAPYRTYSGWCNNLLHPDFGSSFHIFRRFLPSVYEDGISVPRMHSRSGRSLPSGRAISQAVHGDRSRLHPRYTLITMQWGQLLDHDLTFTPMNFGLNNTLLDCSACDSQRTVHSECWPIQIPANDPFFHSNTAVQFGLPASDVPRCLHFVRSLNGQTRLGSREQISQVSAYLDASNIYGSDACDAIKLRTMSNGLLHNTRHPLPNHKPLLPLTRSNIECRAPSGLCFEAGDLRSSEQPALAAMHTVWLREHNRLAKSLHMLNPHWTDERLYQESRRIVSAQMQIITYREFLPRILGLQKASHASLQLLQSGYFDGYDQKCSATIYNEFAAAVFRFGHSLLRPHFLRLNRQFREVEQPLKLRHSFFNSDMLFGANGMDNILRGLTEAHVEVLDSAITEEVTNHLFEERKKPLSGMDLIALNVQRARDHALPGYNEYRVKCNLTKARRFEDLAGEMSAENIERLRQVYEHVDDIDLFPGGMSERSLHGGSVGPTFGCILADQFSRLRRCDRFWFENNDPFVRFSESQLAELRKITLAKIVCENSDGITHIQKEVMDTADDYMNPRVSCKSLPSINFDFWRERNSHCTVSGKLINMGRSEHLSPCVMCTCTREGTICNSMKMHNCFEPMQRYSLNEVLNDPVCQVQCSFAYRLQNYIGKSPNSSNKAHGKQSLIDFYTKIHSMIKEGTNAK